MTNIPFKSSSHIAPSEWKSEITTVNNVDVRVFEPVDTTTPVVVTAPSLSVGTDPTFSVNKIKKTVDEILADNIHAPITCQALINSADTGVFASSNSNGYHLLPVSGKKIHEHLSSGNITEIKTSGGIEAGKNLDVTSNLGRARISHFNTTNTLTGAVLSSASFSHHDCDNAANFALVQSAVGETLLNSDTGKHISFRIGGFEKMRVHSNGFIGINQQAPTEALEVGGNIKSSGNVIATNIKNYYQTVNSANSTVGDNSSTTQITNAGCPSTASDWTRYLSWKTTLSADTINSNSNVFSPQNYGFKSLVAGTYKITVNMAIQAEGTNQSIVIRLAKNTLNDEVADSDQENPGPLAGTGYLPGFTGSNTGKINSFGSASITHIMTLAVNDEVSVYTVNTGQVHGSGVNSHTREGYSQFLAEYLG